ncbi:MAG: S-layer homology domain-containing protein [Lachnospiraceae bacterium]|jgi:M6 family metalloprotease-like protein|nr:S-layer homology domain-containing protein [Lachnospiraceae bacterium]
MGKSVVAFPAAVLAVMLGTAILPCKVQAEESSGNSCNRANVVVVVSFRGVSDDTARACYDQVSAYYTGDRSVSAYMSAISDGSIDADCFFPQYSDGTFTPLVTAKTEDQYLTVSGEEEQLDDGALVEEVYNAVLPELTAVGRKYDYLNAGAIDNLTMVVITPDDTTPSWLYNHSSSYDDPSKVATYNILPYDSSGFLKGYLTHEYLHTFGFPDLYRKTAEGDPVQVWDIMASPAPSLQYPLSYFRSLRGWMDMQEIPVSQESTSYTLHAVDAGSDAGVRLCKLTTPLSGYDSESFYIEYREKNSTAGAFESNLPSSGLIVYRVDDSVENHTNLAGSNYTYVFRPGTTEADMTSAVADGDNNNTRSAAISGGSYGSTDISTGFKTNTIFYADGQNSGIEISNVVCDQAAHSCTFDLTFADYGASDSWDTAIEKISAEEVSGMPYAAATDISDVYLAVSTGADIRVVHRTSGTQSLYQTIAGRNLFQLAAAGGSLYLMAYTDSSIEFYRQQDGSFARLASTAAATPTYGGLQAGDGSFAWCVESAQDGTGTLQLYETETGKSLAAPLSCGLVSGPAAARFQGKTYALYADASGENKTVLTAWDGENWKTVQEFSGYRTSASSAAVCGNTLYFLACNDSSSVRRLITFDGTNASEKDLSGSLSFRTGVLQEAAGNLVLFADTGTGINGYLYRNGGFDELLKANVLGASDYFSASSCGTTVYLAGTGSYGTMARCRVLTAKTPEAELPFTDVSASAWYYASVKYVYQKGLMTGTTASSFGPAGSLTRGQFAAILYRMAGRPEVVFTDKFKDVPDGRYYSAAAIWASSDQVGVLYGDRNSAGTLTGTFRPLDQITRQEMAAAMYRYAVYKSLGPVISGDLSQYPDASSVSRWAVVSMKWATGNSIIAGKKKGTAYYLDPKGKATRAECAAIIRRFCEKYSQ